MANLTPEQRQILAVIRQESARLGAPLRAQKAAIEAGLVESGLRNLNYGDRDSLGYLQQRPSQGWKNPTSIRQATDNFLQRAIPIAGKYGKAGDLAAAVQRPAAQYAGRYQQASRQAQDLLGGSGSTSSRGSGSSYTTTTTPGVDNSGTRRQMLAQYLLSEHQPGALPSLVTALHGAQDTTPTTTTTATPVTSTSPSGLGNLAKIVERASKISAHARPYQWGGGHQQGGGSLAQAFDCSGAVSRVLGINPKVASQFESFGQAGKGQHVTIYAKNDHVIMAINGKFFGTSNANPGGGAGWIPVSALSRSYLSQFTVRHPTGL